MILGRIIFRRQRPELGHSFFRLLTLEVFSWFHGVGESLWCVCLSCRCLDIADSEQVKHRHSPSEHPSASGDSFVACLAHQADRFKPTKNLLDQLSLAHAHTIACVSGGPFVDGARSVRVVLSHMRRNIHLPKFFDKILRIKCFVSTERDASIFRSFLSNILPYHLLSRLAFRRSRRLRVTRRHRQSMQVIHEYMTHKRKFGFFSRSLLIEPCFHICRGLMGIVAALFSMKVYRRIARIVRRSRGGTLLLKTFLAGPRFDQRAIDGKMFVTQQFAFARKRNHFTKECGGNISVKETVTVLGEDRVIPDCIVHRQTHEPSKQQVVVQLLHQQPFTTNGIQHLHKKRPQKLFWWNRWPSTIGVEGIKLGRQFVEYWVDQFTNPAKRMMLGYAIFLRNVTEKNSLILFDAAHFFCSLLCNEVSLQI